MLNFAVNRLDEPTLNDVANGSLQFGYTSGSPAVTSNGGNISTAVVWAVYAPTGNLPLGGALEAFAASTGPGCRASAPCMITPIWSAPIGKAGKFSTVATSGGMVYVGTRDGYVYGFGDTASAALAAAGPATPIQAPVGSTSPGQDVTVTASSELTVTGVSAATAATSAATSANQFGLGKVTLTPRGSSSTGGVSFPVTLHKGDRLTVPVMFSPTVPGGTTGSVFFTTRSPASPSVAVPLTAAGTTKGLYASTTALQFTLVTDTGAFASNVSVGVVVPREVNIITGGVHPGDGYLGPAAVCPVLGHWAARHRHRTPAGPVDRHPGPLRPGRAGRLSRHPLGHRR